MSWMEKNNLNEWIIASNDKFKNLELASHSTALHGDVGNTERWYTYTLNLLNKQVKSVTQCVHITLLEFHLSFQNLKIPARSTEMLKSKCGQHWIQWKWKWKLGDSCKIKMVKIVLESKMTEDDHFFQVVIHMKTYKDVDYLQKKLVWKRRKKEKTTTTQKRRNGFFSFFIESMRVLNVFQHVFGS